MKIVMTPEQAARNTDANAAALRTLRNEAEAQAEDIEIAWACAPHSGENTLALSRASVRCEVLVERLRAVIGQYVSEGGSPLEAFDAVVTERHGAAMAPWRTRLAELLAASVAGTERVVNSGA